MSHDNWPLLPASCQECRQLGPALATAAATRSGWHAGARRPVEHGGAGWICQSLAALQRVIDDCLDSVSVGVDDKC